MASISSTGIGSGLDVTSIITQLVALEKQPLKTLELKATNVNSQISAMGDIKSQFAALTDVATRLSPETAWAARTASSGNTSAATITATGTAAAGSFTLDVDALAQKQAATSAQYNATDLVGAGTMTFRLGTWTSAPAASNAGVIAANFTLSTEQGLLATATSGKTAKDAALVAANAALAAADAALVAPTAAANAANGLLASAKSTLATATSTSSAANSALATANTLLANATVANDNAIAAKAMADANMAAAPAGLAGASDTANTNLTNALAAKVAATGTFNTTNSAFAAADANLTAANNNVASKTLASGAANTSRDDALTADQVAMNVLASSATFGGAGPGAAKDYSDAYTAWVGAVVANDHSSPVLIGNESAALVDLSNKRNLLSPAELSAARFITDSADASDASALKVAAINAAAEVVAATAVVGPATTDRTNALATLTTATNTLLAATDAHATAFAAAATAATALANAPATQAAAATAATDAANALSNATSAQTAAATAASDATTALGVATTDKNDAQTAATNAANALAPFTQTRSTAVTTQSTAAGDAATAATTFNTKTTDVATATTARDNAVTAANALLPVFGASASSSDISVTSTASDTVATLVAKINLANTGVVATVFNDGSKQRLLLTSRDTGAAAGFRVQVSGDGSSDDDNVGLSKLAFDPQVTAYGIAASGVATKYGQDASARINGLAVTSATNTFTDNVPGVTIKVLTTTTSSATMSVSEDVTLAVKNVNDFVTAYNTLNKTLADLTKYDAGTKTASLFQADSSILGLQSVLRNMLGSISTGSSYSRLSDVGIERLLDGSLKMNTSKLSIAANNGTELQKLFTYDNSNTQTNGFAMKFAALGNGLLATGGAVTNKSKALSDVLARNAKDQTKVNDRATATEARLRKTYTALDVKMASLTALNSYVAQQVTTWNKSTG